MPVTCGQRAEEISQREQYSKGGIGRKYWDYRDRIALEFIKGSRILDIGCGEGITLEKTIKMFPDSTIDGIDGDPENVKICGDLGMIVKQADIYEIPFENETIDTCIFMEVIEHLEHPDKALREIARVTKSGGRIIVVYPVDWVMFVARIICLRFKEALFDPGHLRQWTRISLKRILCSCGYRIIASKGLPFPWPANLHGLVVGEKI